ncbi:DUF4232 domain-containing protein [Streptomyces sp. NPDC058001]|uniref:DUF4232 domain-containing protein n=1 Tax=Streptomyces sp. NPDC058001 TaxID=3346300 RepID=UPI0036EA2463
MTVRIARPRVRLFAAATSVALSALALTACQNGEGVRDEGASAGNSKVTTGDEKPAGAKESDGAKESGKSDAKPEAPQAPAAPGHQNSAGAQGSTAGSGSGSTSRKTVTCTGATTRVTVTQVSRPINHLLLTATNTGTAPCYAYGAPYLRFDQAQSAVQFIEDSKPQAVVTLQPGESAYAGIITSSPEGAEGYTAKKLGVLFANRAMNGSVGSEAPVTLPKGGVYVDSSNQVTYWQTDLSTALEW